MAALVKDVFEFQRMMDKARQAGKRIAVVPTMGSLHEGHLSLIRTARKHGDLVVTTVFVNPTQFGPSEDLDRYPRNLEQDIVAATSAGTDSVFAPEATALYPPEYRTFVNVEQLSSVLEGKSRPGHFRGVTTIVAKLFNICKPHAAIFGQKDAQQVVVLRRMTQDLNFDVELVISPTIREHDGLAMSSRNSYLSPEQRSQARVLHQALLCAEKRIHDHERVSATVVKEMTNMIATRSSGSIDYISIADANTLEELQFCDTRRPLLVSLAVRFGATRLIDNIIVTS